MYLDILIYLATQLPTEPMPSKTTPTWLPQVLFESALIVVSILVALGLDEWRENREAAELVDHSLSNFLIEIQQNQARIDDAAPFNQGLRIVMSQHYFDGDVQTVDDFVNMVESFSPAALQSTAWDTALATGSLAKMEYGLVTALSMTYSLQNRYLLATRSGMTELTSPQNLSESKLKLAMYNSIHFLNEVTSLETELGVIYVEAKLVIQTARSELGGKRATAGAAIAKDVAHP